MNKFEQLGISKQLNEAISCLGIIDPTEIQERSIPSILEGKDIVGESATGSGKTLAFGAGIIENVNQGQGIQALVLTPTRELAEQVKESLHSLSKQLRITAIYGGMAMNPQIVDLTRAEVVVATPGRMLDHLQRGNIDTSKIKIVVLDEADRMLDMGFIEDVNKIIQTCPKQRQTLFFSATISEEIKYLAKRYTANAVNVRVRNQVDPSKLKQVYFDVRRDMKLSLLTHLLEHESSELVLVFCNTRKTTDYVAKNLKLNNVDATAIHGGLTQNKRSDTMKGFNSGKTNVLVCTDVAARGLHIDHVTHVYNYEIPKDSKDYVHRIGRTARAGESGKVVNLLCDADHGNFSHIMRDYDFNIRKENMPQIQRIRTVVFNKRPGQGSMRGYPNGRTGSSGRSSFRKGQRYSGAQHHSASSDARRPSNRTSRRERTSYNN
ncbi:DEAD/DEAH box helicase [Candidatus Woesearchaeota archaeon]|nr:DEAD/DEAH box helicase [Candidatus Woesearchaeota archaeon]